MLAQPGRDGVGAKMRGSIEESSIPTIEGSFIPASVWMEAIKPLFREGYALKICPSGRSMIPFIRGGRDEVLLRSAINARLKRGDIVLYTRTDGIHVLHRVHHIHGELFYLLGDAQTQVEGPLKRSSIQAVAASITRKGREIKCDNRLYRMFSSIWLTLRPFRPLILNLYYNHF